MQMRPTTGLQLIPGQVVNGSIGSAPSAASPVANTSSSINYALNG
jgi:hypothetical protein